MKYSRLTFRSLGIPIATMLINMCGAVDQMIAEGMERGLAQGMERVAQEKVWGIRNMIEVCKELGGTYDNTQFQVEMRYHLSQEEAGKYMKQYWK